MKHICLIILLVQSFILAGACSAQTPSSLGYDTTYSSSYYEQKVSLFRLLPDSPGEIIFLGNSLTDIAEWAELWQNPLVKNRGISSDITFGVLNRLDEVTASGPAKLFLMIGINDIARGIPDAVIVANLQKIILQVRRQSPRTQLYLQSLLPTNNHFSEYKGYQNKETHILAVNAELQRLARIHGATYINLHAVFSDADGRLDSRYTNDGLHLNGRGYLRWKEALMQLNHCCP
ncbi:GDSL-type esterase/lipase family protein [Cesiribacter andamanensis]|uniref:GDSL-like Lipase/Acylhydrolase n=1 Tax=Cesiribacter andamanensis AMV16 TaxID=1279009 RepID=M7NVQ6_9BACT|nr:GDSL-type esterase/lipase family protein [Cesiribacter andamanensis]EMR02559.1 GDSL-like Lipase/Acylhydrolase [Cesiribacter andamanensis AMV16]